MGLVGTPVETFYTRIGGNGVAFFFALLAAAVVAWGRRNGVRAL